MLEYCKALCDKSSCTYHSSRIPEELRGRIPLSDLRGHEGKCPRADQHKGKPIEKICQFIDAIEQH